jgi:heat shock protein HtpX
LAKIHKFYFSAPEARVAIQESKFRALFIYALVNAVANPFVTVTRSEVEAIKRSEYSVFQEIFSTHPPIPKRLRFLDQLLLINMAYGARPDPRLQQIVDEVAARLGAPFRLKAVVVDGPPNAFAYGNFLTGRYVAVTSSMLSLTDRRELEAVIGHEIGHHLHRDNALMLLFGVLPSIVYYLGVTAVHMGLSSSNSRGGSPVLIAVGVLAVLASFLIQLLVLAFSRLREYYADTAGAKAAGKEAMQFALAKIHKFYFSAPEARVAIQESKFRALFIYALVNAVANPFVTVTRSEVEAIKRSEYSAFQEIFSTHPPIPKRLRFLDQLQL